MSHKSFVNQQNLKNAAEAQLLQKHQTEKALCSPEKLQYELHVHQIELEMQNEELRRTQLALEESLDRYRDLFDFAPVGYLTLTSDGLITEVNLTAAELLGVERKKLLKRRFAHFIAVNDRERWYKFQNLMNKNENKLIIEVCFEPVQGPLRYGRLDCLVLYTDGVYSLRIALTDISQTKKVEQDVKLKAETLAKVSDGVSVVSAVNERILYVNAALECMFAYSPGELLGKTLAILNASELSQSEKTETKIIMALRQSGVWHGDLLNRRKDHSIFWTHASISTHNLPGWGEVWICIQRDITERKHADANLRESEARYRALLEQAPDGIFVSDVRGNFQIVNEAVAVMLGYSQEELLAMTIFDIVCERQRPKISKYLQWYQNSSTGSTVISDWRFRRRDDSIFIGAITIKKLIDGRFQAILRDVTADKNAAKERLTAMTRQRDTLVQEVHHRIKNHLQGVIGLLRNTIFDHPELTQILETVITRILTIANVHGLQSHAGVRQVLIHDLIAAVIANNSILICYENAANDTATQISQKYAVPLALVINELITNAHKHSEVKNENISVRIKLDSNAAFVSIEITGGPSNLPEDFDFSQRKGLGMGLELVSALLPERKIQLSYRQSGDCVIAGLKIYSV